MHALQKTSHLVNAQTRLTTDNKTGGIGIVYLQHKLHSHTQTWILNAKDDASRVEELILANIYKKIYIL